MPYSPLANALVAKPSGEETFRELLNQWATATATTPPPPIPVRPVEIVDAAIEVAEAEFALIGVNDYKIRQPLVEKLQQAMSRYMAAKLARE